jgi:hypothetical protein
MKRTSAEKLFKWFVQGHTLQQTPFAVEWDLRTLKTKTMTDTRKKLDQSSDFQCSENNPSTTKTHDNNSA